MAWVFYKEQKRKVGSILRQHALSEALVDKAVVAAARVNAAATVYTLQYVRVEWAGKIAGKDTATLSFCFGAGYDKDTAVRTEVVVTFNTPSNPEWVVNRS